MIIHILSDFAYLLLQVEVTLETELSTEDAFYKLRQEVLAIVGCHSNRIFKVNKQEIPLQVGNLRVVSLPMYSDI